MMQKWPQVQNKHSSLLHQDANDTKKNIFSPRADWEIHQIFYSFC